VVKARVVAAVAALVVLADSSAAAAPAPAATPAPAPATIPRPGTREFCDYLRADCISLSNFEYAACFTTNGKPSPALSWCIRQLLLGVDLNEIVGAGWHTDPERTEGRIGYAVAECYSALTGKDCQEETDFSPTRYVKCESDRVDREAGCDRDHKTCVETAGPPELPPGNLPPIGV